MTRLLRTLDLLRSALRPPLRLGRGDFSTRLLGPEDAALYADLQRRSGYLGEALPPVAIGLFDTHGALVGSVGTALEGEGFSPWVGLVVDPRSRGRGGGTALMKALLEEARRRGIRRVACWAVVGRAGSLPVVRAAGFRSTGRWKEGERRLLEVEAVLTRS